MSALEYGHVLVEAEKHLRDLKPPKCFYLNRSDDESGVSGTGPVAVGVQLPSGRCVLEWLTKVTPTGSLGVYDTVADVEAVHGHKGKTKVVFFGEK